MILRAGTVYICGYYNFPKGSASSNYVQNFAQVCLLLGYHIVLMTNVNHKEDIKKHPFLADHPQQVTLHEITLPAGRLSHYVAYNFRLGKYFKEALCQYKIGVNDLLVSYSTLPSINRLLLSLGKCTNVKTCACVVEWFSSKAFPYGKASRRYWEYAYNFYRLFPQFDGIFSISSMLHQHFLNENCHSVVFPILSDPYEYEYIPKTFAGDSAKFIYATNSSKKDTIDVVLNAFGTLSDENLKKCELHLLGADPDMIMNTIPADSRTRVKNILHIHEWLTYGELVCLYNSMDCLIVSRDVNRMTLSNFPSKVPEAMNYGVIPMVAPVGDYTSQYLNETNSVLFKDNSVQGCKDAVEHFLGLTGDQRAALSVEARKTSESRFYYKRWKDVLRGFLQEIKALGN